MGLKSKLLRLISAWNLSFNKRDCSLFEEFQAKVVSEQGKVLSIFPGLSYGPFNNLSSWLYPVKGEVARVRVSLIQEQPEVLHFNHIIIWVRNEHGQLVQYTGPYQCSMSSCAEVLPDPNQVMQGDTNNSVSIHSKREAKPWWEVQFPQDVQLEAIEIYNRKDSWGKRFFSAVVQGFSRNGTKVFEASRVQKKSKLALLEREIIEPLEELLCHYKGMPLAKKVAHLLACLNHQITQVNPTNSAKLKQTLFNVFDELAITTPDVGVDQTSALNFSLEQQNNRYVRVITFRKRQPRNGIICLADAKGQTFELEEGHCHLANEQVLATKCRYSHLPSQHVFLLHSEQDLGANISLWAKDSFSSDLLVIREIQVSVDGENWHTIDSSLPTFGRALALLKLYEFLFKEDWCEGFVHRVGVFMGAYRMHMARSYKKLVGGNNRLLLPSFYQGIEEGGSRSKFLPNVRFTRHGLSVPFSEQDSNFLALRMKEFCEFLEQHWGMKAFPCYGTLLGLYRDKDFLAHDDDIDLAVVVDLPEGMTYRQQTEYWVTELAKKGIKAKPPTPTSLNLHCYFKDCDMDLFFIYPSVKKKNALWTHMQQYHTRDVDRKLILPLSKTRFLGYEFYAPNDIEGFLCDRYGKGWVSPDPFFEL